VTLAWGRPAAGSLKDASLVPYIMTRVGQNRTWDSHILYCVYKRSAKTHIRSYGYGTGGSVSYTVPDIRHTEDTVYIRSYGLGQP